jgi:hypothetical protein
MDHKFLPEGGVFTQDVIDVRTEYKRAEMDGVRLWPHPWKFHRYFTMEKHPLFLSFFIGISPGEPGNSNQSCEPGNSRAGSLHQLFPMVEWVMNFYCRHRC